ncbi:hypothetical protein EDB85DRAFT_2146358 [Lactarius pseudohatsudake]|nr:hypothetical protein EDB85DRAFT_2146358 [Lactarius pseudohatsudake]
MSHLFELVALFGPWRMQRSVEYARLDGWLRAFWFEEDDASCACLAIRDNAWPPNKDFSAVTMWLFWFLLRPGVLELPVFSIVFQG